MNNEEKILRLLEEMRAEQAELRVEQKKQGQELAEMKATLEEVDHRSERTQVLLETDYAEKLLLIAELKKAQ